MAEGTICDGVEIKAVKQVRDDNVLLPWGNRGPPSARKLGNWPGRYSLEHLHAVRSWYDVPQHGHRRQIPAPVN